MANVDVVRSAARSPWVEGLARFGFAARGVVYGVIGLLAVQTAFFGHGRTTGARGALREIALHSRALLFLVAIGLAGFALWRFVQAALGAEGSRRDGIKGIAKRIGWAGTGVVYAGLALAAERIASGAKASAGAAGDGAGFTAELMAKPYGRWLVVLAGLIVIGAGLQQFHKAYKGTFQKRLEMSRMSPDERRLAIRAGQAGLSARGVVFLLSGWFLVQAGLRWSPVRPIGLAAALETLARQPHGPWLLGLVAAGLIAFGAYSLLQARYGRFEV
jgi:hypothetical protein